MRLLPPMAIASESTAIAVNPGRRANWRSAYRTSCSNVSISVSSLSSLVSGLWSDGLLHSKTIQRVQRPDVDPPIHQGRRGVDVVLQIVDRDGIEAAAGRQDDDLAVLAGDVDLPVPRH